MQCPRCGGSLPAGGTCPACGWLSGQTVLQEPGNAVFGSADGSEWVAFPDVCETPAAPAPEVPVPYPETAPSSDHVSPPVKVEGKDAMVKGDRFDTTTGDEPGTGSPGRSRPPGGANPLPVAVLVIALVAVVVVATIYLLAGDDDGNGEPNGHNGPGPDEGLLIDPLETSVVNVWEPVPGLHLDVIILNNATGPRDLDGYDLFVTVRVGTDKVGQATEAVSGDLATGGTKWVPIDVEVDLTSGQTYKVNVLLRKDDGSITVDTYYKEMTIGQS